MKTTTPDTTAEAGPSPSPCSGFLVRDEGFRCSLEMAPPGLFIHGDTFGFKTEYTDHNGPEAYCVESGEYFWGGTDDKEVRRKLQVAPCVLIQNA